MVKPTIIQEDPVAMFQLKEEVDKIKKRDKELGFRTGKTEEFLNSFLTISPAKSKELFDKLSKLNISRLKSSHICKITDLMPLTAEDVKMVLSGYALSISNESAKKISDVVSGFAPKK